MEQKTNIQVGDIVRLTDPISQGQVVRIESVDEHGFASWVGGSQYCNMEQIPCEFEAYPIGENSLANYYETLSDVISDLERIGVKLYPESAVEYWKHHAEKETKEHTYYEKSWEKEHNKLLDAQDEIAKIKKELSRCRAMNADYLTAKKEAENRAKLLEKEVADFKVPDSRQNRHLRDELHKVRLEYQQAWECAEKERKKVIETENRRIELEDTAYKVLAKTQKERDELRERIKRLEADLEEGGFNDERNFI